MYLLFVFCFISITIYFRNNVTESRWPPHEVIFKLFSKIIKLRKVLSSCVRVWYLTLSLQKTDALKIKIQINENSKFFSGVKNARRVGRRTLRKADCVNQRKRKALRRPWARAGHACACVRDWVWCLSVHRRVGGGIASQGMRARQLRVCLCVCDTDGCANGKTDRCLGGSNGMQWWSASHICGEIRAKTSSICGDQPITQTLHPAQGTEKKRATSRFKSPRNKERKAAEFRFPADPPKRAVSLVIDERESRGEAAPLLAHKKTERERRLWRTNLHCSPWFFTVVLLCSYHNFYLRSPEKKSDFFKINFNELENFFHAARWKKTTVGKRSSK